MVSETATFAPKQPAPFAPWHRWDRNFFLTWLVLIWAGIVMGFGSDLIAHFRSHEAPYPLIVHFHAAAFVGWMLLLTAQILLIRNNRADTHRKLGMAGIALAAVMVVLGPVTAIVVHRAHIGSPPASLPAFVSVQFGGIIAFAGLVTAAVLLRHNSPAHKRLMLLAILSIADAGFARWLGGPLTAALGHGFWPFWASLDLAPAILILGIGAYDLATRRRLHPVYIAGACWIFALQLTASYLFNNPAWQQFTGRLFA